VDVGAPVPNITLEAMRDRITRRTRAIVFLEYGGYPVRDIGRIKRYLERKGRGDIALILDAANSPFTRRNGEYSAREYDYAVYSFDMNKLLVTGEGGMVLSDNEDTLRKVKALSYYGIDGSSPTGFARSRSSDVWWETETVAPSLKLGMNNIAAALGLSQLAKIDAIMRKREQVARYYRKALRALESAGALQLPEAYDDAENCVYLFWLTLKDESTRNRLARHLLAHNVYSTVKYQPLDRQSRTPAAFGFYDRALNIPFNQNLTKAHQRRVVGAIRAFFRA
jgi:perosamine synthetase